MDQTAEEGAGGDDDSPCPKFAAIRQAQADHPSLDHDQLVRLAFDDGKTLGLPDRRLHRGGIELPVGLGARTTHRRALTSIEDAKMDAAGIADPAHQTIERVDLANQMALAEAANGGIAGHRADAGETVRHQSGRRAHPR
ncbi:hypothetical protein ACVWWO_004625 [Bradyrhizobium sp. F1.13.1]